MNENGFNRTAPVNEGDEIDVKIEAIGDKGDGIAKKDGFVLVVPNTQLNDEVRIRITKVLRKVGFAEVVGKAESTDEEAEDEEELPEDEEDFGSPDADPAEDSEDFGDEEEH